MKIFNYDKRKIEFLEKKIEKIEILNKQKTKELNEEIKFLKEQLDLYNPQKSIDIMAAFKKKNSELDKLISELKNCKSQYTDAVNDVNNIKKDYKSCLDKEIKKIIQSLRYKNLKNERW